MDSGWRLIVERHRQELRAFLWCGACCAPIQRAQEDGNDEVLATYSHVLPSEDRAVNVVEDMYQRQHDTCANCGAHP